MMVSGAIDVKEQVHAYEDKIDKLTAEKAFFLTENGLSADYLEVQYRCPLCKDTGTDEMGGRCSCFEERLREAEQWQNSLRK